MSFEAANTPAGDDRISESESLYFAQLEIADHELALEADELDLLWLVAPTKRTHDRFSGEMIHVGETSPMDLVYSEDNVARHNVVRATGIDQISDAWFNNEASDEDLIRALHNLDSAHQK